jgi:hypothetical protein
VFVGGGRGRQQERRRPLAVRIADISPQDLQRVTTVVRLLTTAITDARIAAVAAGSYLR